MGTQTLFITESVQQVRVSEIPVSRELASALRKLRITTIGDLSGVTRYDFLRVSGKGTALFREIGQIIQATRNGKDARDAKRAPLSPVAGKPDNLNPAGAHSKNGGPEDAGCPDGPASEAELAAANDTIFIPQEARGTLVNGGLARVAVEGFGGQWIKRITVLA